MIVLAQQVFSMLKGEGESTMQKAMINANDTKSLKLKILVVESSEMVIIHQHIHQRKLVF